MPSYDLTRLGAQSYSFRKSDLSGALRCLDALGLRSMEFCTVPSCSSRNWVRQGLFLE